jgi:hypothetical protein
MLKDGLRLCLALQGGVGFHPMEKGGGVTYRRVL